MQPKPTSEHAWLRRLVGTWTYTSTCDAGVGQEPMVAKGTEVVRAIGELWVVGENTRILCSQYKTPEGVWVPFMKAEFRRVK